MCSSRHLPIAIACLLLAGALSACTIRDDTQRENQLDSLRVMGIASAPADLALGDTASLSALVFAPEGETIAYQWSWCPSRGGSDEAFTCLIDETQLQAAWSTLNTGTTLPPYDLGSAENASLALVFEAEQAFALCELLSRDAEDVELALFTCLSNLGLSIELRVSTATDEVVAIKSIPIVAADAQRNLNPMIGPELSVQLGNGPILEAGAPLQAESLYDLRASIEESESETFVPEEREGEPPPDARGETLYLSWFVSAGSTHRKGQLRKTYFEGGNFEHFVANVWETDFDGSAELAKIYLVLRDERGGIGWAQHEYSKAGAP